MSIYAIIYLCLIMFSLGISLAHHGKPKTGNDNVWHIIIANIITLFLLYKGGFFE